MFHQWDQQPVTTPALIGPPTPAPGRRKRGGTGLCCKRCARGQGLAGLAGCGCAPMEVIVVQEPEGDAYTDTQSETNIPTWLILVLAAAGLFIVLKK